jgi:hypothetical protein
LTGPAFELEEIVMNPIRRMRRLGDPGPRRQDDVRKHRASSDGDAGSRPTRRAALGRLGGAAAAGLGAVAAVEALAPQQAQASTGTMMYGLLNNADGSATSLESTASDWTFEAFNLSSTLSAHAEGVFGYSVSGVGVEGQHGNGSAPDTGSQPGVLGRSTDTPGVFGLSDSSAGVYGQSLSGTAVQGLSQFTGMYGVSVSPSGGGGFAGVVGDSDTNAGVAGFSSAASRAAGEFTHLLGGRGGLFSGNQAQIRLKPGSRGSHPHTGEAGDVYVDSRHRLWFCKGGTRWTQLA